jgi:primase-polymerase (primpol)-like protein
MKTATATRPTRPPAAHIDIHTREAIPEELRNAERWVIWKWWWDQQAKGGAGKWDKPPINHATGQEVDATDPANWATFDQSIDRALNCGDGSGFALGTKTDPSGHVVIDIDHCIDDQGNISSEALELVTGFNSYTERTPSGKGLRIWLRGVKPGDHCRRPSHPDKFLGTVEVYSHSRYLTVTGRRLEGTPAAIANRQTLLDELYAAMFGDPTKHQPNDNGRASCSLDLSDEDLLDKARSARSGKGDVFRALFDDGDLSRNGNDHSSADMALANRLAFWTVCDFGRMERLFSASALGQRSKWKDRPDYRSRTIDRAIRDCQATYQPPPRRKKADSTSQSQPKGTGEKRQPSKDYAKDDRPVIVATHEEHKANDQAIKALAGELSIYQRNLKLVSVVINSKSKSGLIAKIKRPEGTPVIRAIQLPRLREILSRIAQWKKWAKERSGGFKLSDSHPPAWCVASVMSREDWPDIRYLAGVVEVPTLRPDGSVIEQPGYDPATGLLYVPSGKFPSISDHPTIDDAKKAVATLFDLVKDFPFKIKDNVSHNVAWLAALLTVLARFLIDGPTPIFLIGANTSGAGKTFLADLIALITTGRHMTRTGYYHDPIEMDKQIVATCLAGDLVVLFDNVDNGGKFGNAAIDRATTGRTYRGRILGKSEMTPDLDLNAVLFCSGNNIDLCGDVARRIIPCRLESNLERPEERNDFTIKDLAGYTLEHRGELVCAAVTILKAFILAGKPDQGMVPMDFPAWCGLIRNATKWATGHDPAVGRKDLEESDPERQHCAAFVEGWHEVQTAKQSGGMTSADMLKFVKNDSAGLFDVIRNAMGEMWPKVKAGELPSAGSIGMKIQAIRGKVFGDKRFELASEVKRAKVWKVVIIPKSGESSESVSHRRAENWSDKCKKSDNCQSKFRDNDAEQTHQAHQTHQAATSSSVWERLSGGLGAQTENGSLAPTLRFLGNMLTSTPVPKHRIHELADALFHDPSDVDRAAEILKVDRTIEQGVELWSLP